MEKNVQEELERRFLLSAVPEINYESIIRIVQRYKKDHPERIRMEEHFLNPRKPLENFWLVENSRVLYEHTIKEFIDGQESLKETNTELSKSKYDEISPSYPNLIKKLRHVKPCSINKGLKWEIDDFSLHKTENVLLVVAEIEIPSIEYELKIPDWLNPFVLKEITRESLFSNYQLAKRKMYK
jgi:CYTH domain-containing protein